VSIDLRIADITQWYGPRSGGIRTYLHAKADYAHATSTPHAMIITAPHAQDAIVSSSRVIAVRGRTPSDRWGYRVALDPRAVVSALDAIAPNLVIVHDALAFPHSVAHWAREHDAAMVIACHSDLGAALDGLPRLIRATGAPVLARIQTRALRCGDLVLVASDVTRARISTRTELPIVVSPLGVDPDAFLTTHPDLELRRRLVTDQERLLLYVGRLSSDKHTEVFADMLAALPAHCVLAIAGSGPAQRRLLRRARRRGVDHRLKMLGHLARREDIARLMASADCFVHPNPNEPFGLAPLEAIATGCRVVLPRQAGSADILARHGAVLAISGSGSALAHAVIRALAQPRCQPNISEMHWEQTFAREWDIYQSLVQ